MKKFMVLFAVICSLFIGVGFAVADTLTFDDLTGTTYQPFDGPYNGFNFSGAGLYQKPVDDDGNYRWDATNGGYSIYGTGFGYPGISISSSTAFDLESFYVTNDAEGYIIYYQGFLNGSAVTGAYGEIVGAEHSKQYFVDLSSIAAWGNIDKLLVWTGNPSTGCGAHVCLDSIEYNAVPIPGAVWLLGSGLIGLAGIRRKLKARG